MIIIFSNINEMGYMANELASLEIDMNLVKAHDI